MNCAASQSYQHNKTSLPQYPAANGFLDLASHAQMAWPDYKLMSVTGSKDAYPTESDSFLWTNTPAAVVPSSRSTSTRIPTASPIRGSTSRTQGSDNLASHFDLHTMRLVSVP